jgi:hypothetical protein
MSLTHIRAVIRAAASHLHQQHQGDTHTHTPLLAISSPGQVIRHDHLPHQGPPTHQSPTTCCQGRSQPSGAAWKPRALQPRAARPAHHITLQHPPPHMLNTSGITSQRHTPRHILFIRVCASVALCPFKAQHTQSNNKGACPNPGVFGSSLLCRACGPEHWPAASRPWGRSPAVSGTTSHSSGQTC